MYLMNISVQQLIISYYLNNINLLNKYTIYSETSVIEHLFYANK